LLRKCASRCHKESENNRVVRIFHVHQSQWYLDARSLKHGAFSILGQDLAQNRWLANPKEGKPGSRIANLASCASRSHFGRAGGNSSSIRSSQLASTKVPLPQKGNGHAGPWPLPFAASTYFVRTSAGRISCRST
jgi:hypothetical protein